MRTLPRDEQSIANRFRNAQSGWKLSHKRKNLWRLLE